MFVSVWCVRMPMDGDGEKKDDVKTKRKHGMRTTADRRMQMARVVEFFVVAFVFIFDRRKKNTKLSLMQQSGSMAPQKHKLDSSHLVYYSIPFNDDPFVGQVHIRKFVMAC